MEQPKRWVKPIRSLTTMLSSIDTLGKQVEEILEVHIPSLAEEIHKQAVKVNERITRLESVFLEIQQAVKSKDD